MDMTIASFLDSFQTLQKQQADMLLRFETLTDDYHSLYHAHKLLRDDYTKLARSYDGLKAQFIKSQAQQVSFSPDLLNDIRMSIAALQSDADSTKVRCGRTEEEVENVKIKLNKETNRFWSAIRQIHDATSKTRLDDDATKAIGEYPASDPDAYVFVARSSATPKAPSVKDDSEDNNSPARKKRRTHDADYAREEAAQAKPMQDWTVDTPELARTAYGMLQETKAEAARGTGPESPLVLLDDEDTHMSFDELQSHWQMRKQRVESGEVKKEPDEEDESPRRSRRPAKAPARYDGCILYTRRDRFE